MLGSIGVRGLPERDISSLGAMGRGGWRFEEILPSPPPPPSGGEGGRRILSKIYIILVNVYIKLDNIVILPILRAGLGMVKGAQDLMPNARVGYIGMERDHKTHKPVDHYFKIPKVTDSMVFIVLDPMLATGGTMIAAIDRLKDLGVKNIVSICIISSPEGMNQICNHHQDVKIYTGSLDKKLNNNKYIVPGLGDAGDRLYGTE